MPDDFVPPGGEVTEEVVVEAAPQTRGSETASDTLDISCDLKPNQSAVLVVRHASGALTFHPPLQTTSRGVGGAPRVRFQATVRQPATRGIGSRSVKAIVVAVGRVAADKIASFALPKLAAAAERAIWQKLGLREGWVRVTRPTLAAFKLEAGVPVSPSRSLLLLHGTFSNTVSGFKHLASSTFFERVKPLYDDRIYGFDHFTVSRRPEDNARMLLEALPEQTTTFDVVTHSRGGLVLRNLAERGGEFGDLGRRFNLGRAVLVASPNDGTPLATPKRWRDAVGWIANLLEMFPDNPFASGSEFVANGLEWIANHASGDLPGLQSMDREGDLIGALQGPPGAPSGAYSALVSNYQPDSGALWRLMDAGLDQFFGSANDLVVPSEGGWRTGARADGLVPDSRIGCFGPGGNLPGDAVTHVDFFSHPETVDFLVNALAGRPHGLKAFDARRTLPDRRLVHRDASSASLAAAPMASAAAGSSSAVQTAARRSRARRAESALEPPLRITVVNGDLTFETEPLLIGHYQSTRLTGSELAMDTLIGGTMAHSLAVGMYPQSAGAHQIFINRRSDLERRGVLPRPKAVIVVGLGPEGKLQAADLVRSTRQAVIAWAQRVVENVADPNRFELAATLMGSGGSGVSAGQAACLIAQGVCEANERLQDYGGDAARPRVTRLELAELYLDRATEAWRALRLQEAATPGRFQVDDAVAAGTGPLLRPPDSGYRGADYDFVSVESVAQSNGQPLLSYTLDTRRARSEVRAQRAQSQLLNDLIKTASNDQNHDQQLGRTLFNLLIPVELEAYLGSSGTMQIELDPETARVPWELLDTNAEDDRVRPPWSIRTRLIRKLRVEGFRDHVVDADADASALVIGEPKCPDIYPRLEGARREALAVQACLTGALDEDRVRGLISADAAQPGPEALNVVNALFERPWRIVHISGHGAISSEGKPSGVVLSNGTFLGANEIRNMRAVPELVFVNCCHLATADSPARLPGYDRAMFASGVAGALIEIGVRCVIAAGWAVDDDGASVFAETFYASMLRGRRFVDAIGEAREQTFARSPNLNTWAAYQCYGDPDWVFVRDSAAAHHPPEDYSGVGSATSLRLALMRNVVQTKFQGADPSRQLASIQDLEQRFAEKWGFHGDVAEAFAEAFVEAGAVELGMRWYERAVAAPDGTATMKAAENLSNVRARLGWENVEKAQLHRDAMRKQRDDVQAAHAAAAGRRKSSKRTARATAAGTTRSRQQAQAAAKRALADAETRLRGAIRDGWRLTRDSLALLNRLRAIDTSLERESLVGSVYKRQALIASADERHAEVARQLRDMERAYRRAQEVGERNGATDLYYPAVNRLMADVALNAGRRGWRGLNPTLVDIIQTGLKAKIADADFWVVVGDIELRQYQAVASRSLPAQLPTLVRNYTDLHLRAASSRMWASVYDTARLALRNYLAGGSAKEKKAVSTLLDLLRDFANREDGG